MKIKKAKELQLGSITDEATACRKAFKDVKAGEFVLHCHHEILGEILTQDPENRITYILSSKPEHEQALRLHLFRPIPKRLQKEFKSLDADYIPKRDSLYADYIAKRDPLYADYIPKRDSLYADYIAKRDSLYADYIAKRAPLHTEVCIVGCPWNGKTIFPKA